MRSVLLGAARTAAKLPGTLPDGWGCWSLSSPSLESLVGTYSSRWEENVLEAVQRKDHGIEVPTVNFECKILKSDEDAERHIQTYLPSLAGRGAIVNVGTMEIKSLKFESTPHAEPVHYQQHTESAADYLGADESHDEVDLLDILREEVVCDTSTRVATSGKVSCSSCKPSCENFTEILREELQVEGLLFKHGFKEEKLTGWRQKQVVLNGSEDPC
ncbi:hypothetical protein L7F22_022859 [Adiantum nelumboides]|nr:hypothetical protein [Adiantum nelumboides]